MKIKYKILIGLVYTIIVGFIVSTIQHRLTMEELKSQYEEEYCEVVNEYTGGVDGDQWNELFAVLVEIEEERNELQEIIDSGLDEYYEEYFEKDGGSDADAWISLFYNLTDPINWLFTFIIATFIATFYLAFYSAKLWIQRYFKGEIDDR